MGFSRYDELDWQPIHVPITATVKIAVNHCCLLPPRRDSSHVFTIFSLWPTGPSTMSHTVCAASKFHSARWDAKSIDTNIPPL